jgi:hypothetical protein
MELVRERHFYLYAKNHYKTGDIIEDHKIILGKYCAIEPKHIRELDIIRILSVAAFRHIKEREFYEFIEEIDPNHWWYKMKPDMKYNFYEKVITRLSVIIGATRVFDKNGDMIMNLGEADYTILPKPKHIEERENETIEQKS